VKSVPAGGVAIASKQKNSEGKNNWVLGGFKFLITKISISGEGDISMVMYLVELECRFFRGGEGGNFERFRSCKGAKRFSWNVGPQTSGPRTYTDLQPSGTELVLKGVTGLEEISLED